MDPQIDLTSTMHNLNILDWTLSSFELPSIDSDGMIDASGETTEHSLVFHLSESPVVNEEVIVLEDSKSFVRFDDAIDPDIYERSTRINNILKSNMDYSLTVNSSSNENVSSRQLRSRGTVHVLPWVQATTLERTKPKKRSYNYETT